MSPVRVLPCTSFVALLTCARRLARPDLAEHEFASVSVAGDAAEVALAAHPAELILALIVHLPLPTIYQASKQASTKRQRRSDDEQARVDARPVTFPIRTASPRLASFRSPPASPLTCRVDVVAGGAHARRRRQSNLLGHRVRQQSRRSLQLEAKTAATRLQGAATERTEGQTDGESVSCGCASVSSACIARPRCAALRCERRRRHFASLLSLCCRCTHPVRLPLLSHRLVSSLEPFRVLVRLRSRHGWRRQDGSALQRLDGGLDGGSSRRHANGRCDCSTREAADRNKKQTNKKKKGKRRTKRPQQKSINRADTKLEHVCDGTGSDNKLQAFKCKIELICFLILTAILIAGLLAQLVERWSNKPTVIGSIPIETKRTISFCFSADFIDLLLAVRILLFTLNLFAPLNDHSARRLKVGRAKYQSSGLNNQTPKELGVRGIEPRSNGPQPYILTTVRHTLYLALR